MITVFVTQSSPGTFFVDSDQTVHVNDSVTINDAALDARRLAADLRDRGRQPLNDVPVGTFTDANPFATAADFSATINWGDGSGRLPTPSPRSG